MVEKINSKNDRFDPHSLTLLERIPANSDRYIIDSETRLVVEREILKPQDVDFLRAFVEEMLVDLDLSTQEKLAIELSQALDYLENDGAKTIESLNNVLVDGPVKMAINSILDKNLVIDKTMTIIRQDRQVILPRIIDKENLTDEDLDLLTTFIRNKLNCNLTRGQIFLIKELLKYPNKTYQEMIEGQIEAKAKKVYQLSYLENTIGYKLYNDLKAALNISDLSKTKFKQIIVAMYNKQCF